MSHTIEIFNVGNGDSALVTLDNGRMLQVDFCNRRAAEDDDDPRIDLSKRLREILASRKRDSMDVVAFTHLDEDHIAGSTEFFYLDHAKKYQSSTRIKIDVLWVPAAAIVEGDLPEEARVIREEAHYRLRQKKGVRVFSRPQALSSWLKQNDISMAEVEHLITDAGRTADEFSLTTDGMEAFIHAPLARRLNGSDGGTLVDRNQDCLVFQARFSVSGAITDALFTADMTEAGWTDIVAATKEHDNEDRLCWDLYNVPHHCSYTGIGPEKGDNETVPNQEVAWLLEEQGRDGSWIVSSSDPIPVAGSEEDECDQPPHRQAATYYKRVAKAHGGKFLVTMEEPTTVKPKPIVYEITRFGLKRRLVASTATVIGSTPPSRAG